MANYYTWSSPDPVPSDTKIAGSQWRELKTVLKQLRGYMVDIPQAYGGGGASLGGSGPYATAPFNDAGVVPPGTYTGFDVTLGTDDSVVRNVHVNSLRNALNDLCSTGASYGVTWCQQYSAGDGAAVPGNIKADSDTTRVRAVHVNELRAQLDLVDSTIKTVSPFCPTACQVGCQLSCQTACLHACQACNNSTCHDQMCGVW